MAKKVAAAFSIGTLQNGDQLNSTDITRNPVSTT
jgi:hypothetical protein